MSILKSATVQFNHTPGNKAENLRIMRKFIKKAAAENIQLVVFPEMCITGYWHVRNLTRSEILGLAERVPDGSSCTELISLARESGMMIGAGLIEKTAEDIRTKTGSGTTAKAVELLLITGKDKTITERFNDYLNAGLLGCYMAAMAA